VRGDLIQVFARALEFYKGKVKGFKGIHEDIEVRETTMKAELKLLIRDIISEMIAKWNVMNSRINFNAVNQFKSVSSNVSTMVDSSQNDL
jgi:hypothetical protein